MTWPKNADLEDAALKDEFSYPAIIVNEDKVVVTYTWIRKKKALWRATKDWILENAKPIL